MDSLPYTRMEHAKIGAAWTAILARLETTVSGEARMNEALRLMRDGGVRPLAEAKAHTVKAFLRGMTAGSLITAADLDGLARGYVAALIVGAGYTHRRPQDPELSRTLRAAEEAHEAALQRYIAATHEKIAALQS